MLMVHASALVCFLMPVTIGFDEVVAVPGIRSDRGRFGDALSLLTYQTRSDSFQPPSIGIVGGVVPPLRAFLNFFAGKVCAACQQRPLPPS